MRDLDLCCYGVRPCCDPATVWLRFNRRGGVFPLCRHHADQAWRTVDRTTSPESATEMSRSEALVWEVLLS